MASRGGERAERALDFLGEELVHRLRFGVALLVGDEALDQRAVALGVQRRVEPDLAGVERGERLHHVDREAGGLRDLLGRGLAAELLPQVFGGPHDAREVGRAVERHPHRPALARERGQDRLADPPHGVGDELDALVGIEFAGGGEEADVALADQVGEREAAVLVLLGHRDDEAEVALHQLLHRLLVAARAPAWRWRSPAGR